MALGAAALLLLLVVLGVRGCLDARKERAFENYLRDLSGIVANTNQLSSQFFALLNDPGDRSTAQFQAEIASYRGAADELLQRTEGLDTPEELSDAQDELVAAYRLRARAMNEISDQMGDALSNRNNREARQAIAQSMRTLLASDVLYLDAKTQIEAVLAEEEIEGEVPDSVFLPEPVERYLDDLELGALLARVAGGTGAAADGVHGTELVQSLIRPGDVALTTDAPTTVGGNAPPEVEVTVLNGGDTPERDVVVTYELSGAGVALEGEGTIDRIDPGEQQSVTLAISEEVPEGEEMALTVTVHPVNGETIIDNNQASYPVIFE